MAAFTAPDPEDEVAFRDHWAKIQADPTVLPRTVLVDGTVAGHVLSHHSFGELEVGYWLGREFWGQGIATRAVELFLKEQTQRPIAARVAFDNIGSRRVLEKCGFVVTGEDQGYANARGKTIKEFLLRLDN